MSYRFLEHMADVKFRAEGSTIERMFISAADALNETIRGDIKILEQKEKSFEVEGKDKESLLYNFLEEFLFLLDAKGFLAARVKSVSIKENKLKCVVSGDNVKNYKFTNDVKAVTYSDMFVRETEVSQKLRTQNSELRTKWECQVVLDV